MIMIMMMDSSLGNLRLIAPILLVFTLTTIVSSQQQQQQQHHHQHSCDVSINKRVYRPDKRLYTHKQYEIQFGLAWEAANPPIGYSMDIDCRNLSKLRAAYSFDLKDMPIEINSINCSKTMQFIHVLESSRVLASSTSSSSSNNNFKNSFLVFLVDFRSLKIQSSSTIRLSVNRQLGKGCSTQLTFVKHDDSSTSIFEHDYYDGTSIWTNIRALLETYARTLANPPVLLALLVAASLVLASLLLFIVMCVRRKSFQMSEFKFNSTLVSLKNIKRRCQHQTAKRFNARKNRAADRQVLASTARHEMREDEATAGRSTRPAVLASCPEFSDVQNHQHAGDFHVLREHLMNRNQQLQQ